MAPGNLFAGLEQRCTRRGWAVDAAGEGEGEGGELREQRWHVHALMCYTDGQWEAAVWHRGSAACSVMT